MVLYNIVHLKIPTETIDQKKLKRYRRPLSVITDKKIGARQRLSTLRENSAAVALLVRAALPGLKSSLST